MQKRLPNSSSTEKRPKILLAFNSKIEKHGSFEDYMLLLASSAVAMGYEISYLFPSIETGKWR